ncbi:MAG TPA: hypothetical protein PKH37_09435 [Alphaproteobacteria bacterium]|nr:hypothetical protein [Alphaproteobacteria bacterium]
MARVWYHIAPSTGEWTEWGAGTLPSAESLFRYEFLNQFIGWMRYTGNFSYNGDYHIPAFLGPSTIPYFSSLVSGRSSEKFLLPGDNLQDAALWNSILQYDATNAVEFEESAWIKTDYDAILTPDSELDPENEWADLAADEDYAAAAATESELTAGDIIQWSRADSCQLRVALKNARTRLDLCKVVDVGMKSVTNSYEAKYFGYDNVFAPGGSGGLYGTYSYPFESAPPLGYFRVRSYRIFGPGNEYFSDWIMYGTNHYLDSMIIRPTRSAYKQIAQKIVLASTPVSNSLPTYPLWPSDGVSIVTRFAVELESDGTSDPITFGYFIPDAPSAECDEEGSVYLNKAAVVLEETLPSEFRPSAGFPWEE